MLLTIAGSSCSGKTTLATRACAGLPGVAVHDFDELGVPSDADRVWRQRTLQTWLERAETYLSDGVDMVLTSQSPLGEVLAAPSAPALGGIAAALLDVADTERLTRLAARDPGKWDQAAQEAFLGWARWHREHARDPRHLPEAIRPGWDAMRWDRWSTWTSTDPRWSVTVIDTTARTPAESAADLRHWIEQSRASAARLPLTGDWAAR